MLPRVKIYYENGNIGAVSPLEDGLLGLVATGESVGGTFEIHKPYILSGYDGLGMLGVTAENNPGIEKLVREFYAEAGAGTRVYLMGMCNTLGLAGMLDVNSGTCAKKLLEASSGAIRGIVASRTPAAGYEPEMENGLDSDVYDAIARGQALAEWSADTLFAPVFVLVEGRGYTGNPVDLQDLGAMTDNRVAVFIGDTEEDSGGASVGLVAGRIAKNRVQRNIGAVADGAVKTLTAFIADKPAELADVTGIHDKGFITFRTFVGRSGYFFTDDPLATLPTDDYHYLSRRRVIDKAYRIAYNTMLDELLGEFPVNTDGTLQAPMRVSWQTKVETAIAANMTANGELSADVNDPADTGCECLIDPEQNVVSTGKVKITLRVRPFGYARYIDVYLGFTVTAQQ
jgi:hypothetical protein